MRARHIATPRPYAGDWHWSPVQRASLSSIAVLFSLRSRRNLRLTRFDAPVATYLL